MQKALLLIIISLGINFQSFSQNITGTVTDSTGTSLPGVNIKVKSKTTGTSTDSDGHYSLKVSSLQDTLVFSYIGYATKTVPVGGRTTINITLKSQTISGQQIVIVGYGEQQKNQLIESVTQISGSDITQTSPSNSNIAKSLEGKVAGLNITQSGGAPGQGTRINIRGYTSINGGSPLVLIDGVQGNINDLNPNDVKSVSVLKGPAASSIYGSRGAFGVVLVTTKSAKTGGIKVSYGDNFSWKQSSANRDYVTDPYKADTLTDIAFRRSVGHSYTGYTQHDYQELKRREKDPSLPDVVVDNRNGQEQYVYYGNTDWWHYFFRRSRPSQSHHISISGGNDQLQARVSGRYTKEMGILRVQDEPYKRYNARAKVHYNVNDWLRLSDNAYLNSSNNLLYGGSMYGGFSRPFGSLIWVHALPSYVPKNPDGSAVFRTELNNYTIGDGSYAALLDGHSKQTEHIQQLSNTAEAVIQPVNNFSITANYTSKLLLNQLMQRTVEVPWSIHPGEIEFLGHDQLYESRHHDSYGAVNAYADYHKSIDKNNLKAKVGFNYEHKQYDYIGAHKRNSISINLNALDLATSDPQANGNSSKWVTMGYFFRVNYNYDKRYLLEVNGRYDGTSRFPKGHRYGFFPSASVGWLISDEDFMKGAKNLISNLKLRVSYGTLGNQQVGTYAYASTLSQSLAGNYLINGDNISYLSPPGLNPRSITWAKVKTANIGLDFSLLQSTITGNFDLYQRRTVGMLTKGRTLPAVLGTSPPQENAADLRTRGFEVTLSYRNTFKVADKPFNFKLTGTVSNSMSTITKFDNPNKFIGDYYDGQQIGEIWGYHIDGLFKSHEEAVNHADQQRVSSRIYSSPGKNGQLLAGDVKYADLNGDGVISNGDNTINKPGDRRIIGNASPQFPYSFTINLNWNRIDFSAFFRGIGKQDWYPNGDSRIFWGPYDRAYSSFQRKDLVDNIWSEDNPDGYFPRLRSYVALSGGGELNTINDRYLQNVAYLRLKNLTIGYTLPLGMTQSFHLNQVRFYVSGENLLTFSPLTDYIDPEAASNAVVNLNNTATANNQSTAQLYPFSKTYSLGIDIRF